MLISHLRYVLGGSQMRTRVRSVAFLGALAAATIIAVSLAETTVAGQARPAGAAAAAPKTPWGAPDLQGTWSSTTVVPFARAQEFGNREFLTDDEYKKALDQLLERNTRIGRDSRE